MFNTKERRNRHVSSANQLIPSPSEGGDVNPQMDFRLKPFARWAASQGCLVWNIQRSNSSRNSKSPINLLCSLPFRLSTFVTKPLISTQGITWASMTLLLQLNFHAVNKS